MITEEQWKEIEDRLKHSLFVIQKFKYGDHEISTEKRHVAENRTALAVFIDGKIEWKWSIKAEGRPEVIELFWRQRTKSIYSEKEKARLIKGFGKRRAKEYFPKLDEKIVSYDPTFNTAKSLVRQFKKVDGLELFEEPGTTGE